MKLLSLTLLLSSLCCSLTSAQIEKHKTCRILFLERPANSPQTLYLFDGKTSQEVELPKMNLSKVYEIDPKATAIALLTKPIEKAEDIPTATPKAIIQAEVVDFYLLVAADPLNAAAPLRLRLVDIGNQKLRPGQTLWFNLTEYAILGELGSQKLIIKPQGSASTDEPTSSNENYPVKLAYMMEGKNDIYPICETQWTHQPKNRNLAFILNKAEGRTPRVMVFPDFRMEKKDKIDETVTE